jgi:hypothetical protein
MLSNGHGLMLALLLAAVCAYSFWGAFRLLAKSRLLRDTPTARIRSAAQGYAEFSGKGAVPPRVTIKGPLTGLECVWWRYRIQERGGIGKQRGYNTIDTQTSEAPFLLDDGTGRCLVDPGGAEVVPHVRTVWYGSTAWPEYRLPPGQGVLGKFVDALFSGGPYRYIEHRLNVADPLYALGEFRTQGGVGNFDADDGIAQLLHEWKRDQAKLLERFDANHDGRIDAAEWEQVRAAARTQVLAKRHAEENEPTVPIIGEPGDGRPYLLSVSDQASLARRFSLLAALAISIFLVSVALLAMFLRTLA